MGIVHKPIPKERDKNHTNFSCLSGNKNFRSMPSIICTAILTFRNRLADSFIPKHAQLMFVFKSLEVLHAQTGLNAFLLL